MGAAVLLWLLFATPVAATVANARVELPSFVIDGSMERLRVDDTAASRSIADGLLIHKDAPDQPMTATQLQRILSLPRSEWQSGADPAVRDSSFVPTTMWMLGLLENPSKQRIRRWLVMQSWRLWDVRLFVIDADSGVVLASHSAGQRVAMAEREIQTQEATFPLSLAAGQKVLLALRIQDKSFAVVGARLHDPAVRVAQRQRLHDVSVALLGFIVAIALVLLVQGDWRYAVVAFWLLARALFELSFQVPLLLELLPSAAPHFISVFTISAALGSAAFAVMTLSFLEISRNRGWLVFYGACIAVLISCSLIVPWTEEHQVVRRLVAATALLILATWPLAAWCGRHIIQRPYGGGLLLLFTLYWAVDVGRVMMVNGLLKLDIESHPLVLIYLSGMLVFALGIVGLDGRRRRDLANRLRQSLKEREAAERRRMLAQQEDENARLAAEVAKQTEALRRVNVQAMASSEAKSKFLSSASHELRAPLHDLLGYAQLLAREVPAQARNHLAVIQKSGNQLLHLIDDILEFSRGEARPMVLDRAPLSLPGLAAHLEAICAPEAARGGNALTTRLRLGAIGWVIADERKLTQVLRNLLENACKYTRDGVIELGIEALGGADDQGEAVVRFSVRDTGIGIPPDQQETIFEAFKRLDRYDRPPGLGLGLAISQQIVVAKGGRIQVESRQGPGGGSRFHFDLRLCTVAGTSATACRDNPRAILGYRGRPRTVLVVDDRASSRRLLAERCELLGLEVLEAGDGHEALELLRSTQPDIALVDQFMPGLDGWGFLRRVRASERHRALPVVLISAAPRERPEGFPETAEFDAVALKPLSPGTLTDILGRHLALEWEYAEAVDEDSDPSAAAPPRMALPTLPAGCCDLKLAQLNEMLSLGAVVAIEQWAVEMTATHPAYAALWSEIKRCATSVDLVGLRALADQLQTASGDGTAGA